MVSVNVVAIGVGVAVGVIVPIMRRDVLMCSVLYSWRRMVLRLISVSVSASIVSVVKLDRMIRPPTCHIDVDRLNRHDAGSCYCRCDVDLQRTSEYHP